MSIRLIQQEQDVLQGSYTEIPLFYPSFDDNGVLVATNITGAVITFSVRKTATSTELLRITTANSIQITDAVNGKFKLKLPSALTSALTERVSGVYKGQVEVTLSGETVRTHCITLTYSPEFVY